jgi:glycerophosphoryl diester phosphodiesterase
MLAQTRRLFVVSAAMAALVCATSGCGGGGSSGAPGPAQLRSIAVTPARHAIAVNATAQFTAIGTYSDGTLADLTGKAIWTSDDSAVALIDAAGRATGVRAGQAVMTATAGTLSADAVLTVLAPLAGNFTLWNFDNPLARLAASSGPAELRFRDPSGAGWGPQQTQFAKASALGLPLVDGGDADVMAFPATGSDQGYTLTHHAAANGVFMDQGLVSNYSLVMDVLWPAGYSGSYRSLFQTDALNADDADLFVADVSGDRLGVGINGRYHEYGAFIPGTWHRITVVVQCALGDGGTGQIHKYVDGLFVGGQYTPAASSQADRCRWALGPEFHLFTDNDGETARGFVSSILFVDRLMFADEVRALGGPNAAGANIPGAAAPLPPQLAARRADILGHRGNSGRSPENTLASILQAFAAGSDHVEIDVRLSADGHAVLMHDETIDRTTNGAGAVSAQSLIALQSLDAGSWLDPAYATESVPSLVQALTAAAGRGKLLLDVKSANAGASIRQALDTAGLGQSAVWVARNQDVAAAADFRRFLPDSGILWGAVPAELDAATFNALKSLGVVGFEVDYDTVTRDFVQAAHANGLFVIVYTVLDPDAALRMIDLGVDGIETDFPAMLDSLMPAPLQ